MTSQGAAPAVPAQTHSRVRYYAAALALCGPWFLMLDQYSDGGRNLFGDRLFLSLSVGVTMMLAVTCLIPIVGRPKGSGHVGGAILLLLMLVIAFAVTLPVLGTIKHMIEGTPYGDKTVGLPGSMFGSGVFVLYTAAAFTVVKWYAVLPLALGSYALLTWAAVRRLG